MRNALASSRVPEASSFQACGLLNYVPIAVFVCRLYGYGPAWMKPSEDSCDENGPQV